MRYCHSGLDPWFDRPFDRLTVLSKVEGLTTLSKVEGLTTLSKVEGESSAFSKPYVTGCRIRSGMTDEKML